MFKKVSTTILVASTIVFGGAIQASASASDQGESFQGETNSHQEVNKIENMWGDVSSYIENYFINWEQGNWNWQSDQQSDQESNQSTVQEENQTVGQPNTNVNENVEAEPTEEVEKETENNTESTLSEYDEQVVQLTNTEREKQGLAPLEIDEELSKVALEKSKDMAAKNYFDHNSPTYGSPFDMMKSFNINYQTAGENIAKGQQTPEEVVNAWMNSAGHRENILNGNFTHIGVGYDANGNHWTQMFIGK